MSTHWEQVEGGSRFSYRLLSTLALYGGRRFGLLLLYPVILYVYCLRGAERAASKRYLRRALGRPPTRREVYRHFYEFGTTILDRIYLLSQGESAVEVETEGVEALEAVLALRRGVLLLGSHQGSFEALRSLARRRPDIPLRVVLDRQKTPALTTVLEALAPDVAANVIDASQDGASITLAMNETCQRGGMVALLADRGHAAEGARRVDFMGYPAPLPTGPWLLAHALKVPVMLCFGLYLGGNRYRLIFEPFAEQIRIPRDQRSQALDLVMSRYAARLEHYVQRAPYNWFNFYDFWQDPTALELAVDDSVGERLGI